MYCQGYDHGWVTDRNRSFSRHKLYVLGLVAELVALAMNPPPTTALRNTCAGITELHIFQLPVRVIVMLDGQGDGEHLELIFGNEKSNGNRIKPNRFYGTMPLLEPRY